MGILGMGFGFERRQPLCEHVEAMSSECRVGVEQRLGSGNQGLSTLLVRER